ncbi:MAG: TolB family protein, partial [Kiritimatiellia bacterium]
MRLSACVGLAFALAWCGVHAAQREVTVPGDWERLPPADVDPALADTPDPRTRAWSGQKASLRFARIFAGEGSVRIDWTAAQGATNAPTLRGDTLSLWKGRAADKPAITEPRLFWIVRDLRLFRGAAPDPAELLPVCVVEDGNPEDGFGGYVIGLGARVREIAREAHGISLTGDGAPLAWRFDGNWIAGLQAVARQRPAWFAAPDGMDADLWISVVAEWVQDEGKWGCAAEGWPAFLAARRARREALLADPRLKETLARGLTFITRRQPTWNHEVAQYFGWRQDPGGSVLVLERPGRSLRTRDLIAGRLPKGSFLQPRLSYDARKLLFSFVATDGAQDPYSVIKVNEEDGDHHYYHLWEVNIDGTGLRQITRGVYEDFMPEFLPDGDIVFMSSRRRSQSRCFWYGYSNRWQAYTMFRMRPDGTEMQQLSWNDVAEWFPTMGNDGEILFALWDYIDRDAVRHQNLWSMRPDGTNPKALWG